MKYILLVFNPYENVWDFCESFNTEEEAYQYAEKHITDEFDYKVSKGYQCGINSYICLD